MSFVICHWLPYPSAPLLLRSLTMPRQVPYTPLLLLLLALALRVYGLGDVPPGLTHDEANHGWEALSVLDGRWLYYFPVGYGREPLYGYLLAGAMTLFGRSIFALRYVSGLAAVLAIALSYGWAKKWLGRDEALLGAGLTAVSFWSLAIGRQLLRSSLIPLLMMAAVWLFWQMLRPVFNAKVQRREERKKWGVVIGLGVVIALLLHTYIAARVAWVLFPLFLLYLILYRWLFAPNLRLTANSLQFLLSLALGGLLSAPLFIHLAQNPHLETRVEMLSGTLDEIKAGNFEPLLRHVREGVLALFWPGAGDAFLAYNIPGRPVLEAVTAVAFLLGFGLCLTRWRNPVYPFLLLWLLIGLAPSLITGATANTTRNIVALPALYLVAAVGLAAIQRGVAPLGRYAAPAVGVMVLGWAGISSGYDYFVVWGNLPEVRAAYQTSIIAAVQTVNERVPAEEAAVLSSVWPGPAHDPSISQLVVDERTRPLRWVDGRLGLVFPLGQATTLVAPASAPLHSYFQREWATAAQPIPLRPNDLDPTLTIWQIAPPELCMAAPRANFNYGLELLDSFWLAESTPPGGVAELLTLWRVLDPGRVGPIVTPVFTTEASLFTHILRPDGSILAQADGLDAPSWDWQAGDIIAQVHQIYIPPDTPPATYPVLVGVYTPTTEERLPLVGGGDTAAVRPLLVE